MERADVADIYSKLRANYGAAFTRSFPAEVIEDWYRELRRFTAPDGKQGVKEWVRANPDRYPNLPQLTGQIRSLQPQPQPSLPEGPIPGSTAWHREREARRLSSAQILERIRGVMNGETECDGATTDQRQRAYRVMQEGREGWQARAKEILTEHRSVQGAGHR